MDATSELSMPAALPTDSNDVQVALTTAQSLWGQDPREALRWLRKAAEGAADAGDDLRSVQLARAAADLRNQAGVTASLNPPVGDGASSAVAAPAAGSVPHDALSFGLGQNPAQTVPATPAAAAAAALQQASMAAQAMQNQLTIEQQAAAKVYAAQQEAAATQAAQAVAAQAAAAALAQSQTAAQLAQTARHPAVTTQRLAPSAVQTPAPIVQPAVVVAAAAMPPAPSAPAAAAGPVAAGAVAAGPVAAGPLAAGGAPVAAPAVAAALESSPHSAPPSAPFFVTHRSVRVALSPAPNGHGEFMVHPLAEGEAVPAGWKDALLVALDPVERLFPGRG